MAIYGHILAIYCYILIIYRHIIAIILPYIAIYCQYWKLLSLVNTKIEIHWKFFRLGVHLEKYWYDVWSMLFGYLNCYGSLGNIRQTDLYICWARVFSMFTLMRLFVFTFCVGICCHLSCCRLIHGLNQLTSGLDLLLILLSANL